jgi:hypothetical protein
MQKRKWSFVVLIGLFLLSNPAHGRAECGDHYVNGNAKKASDDGPGSKVHP